MTKQFNYISLTLIIALFMSSCFYTEEADLIVHNAKIYTVDERFSTAEAMAIKDGKIIEVGPNNQIKNKYATAKAVDAKLAFIFPGFIDSHCHFLGFGNTFFEVDLIGAKSWQEVIDRTLEFSKTTDDQWITGRGWDQNKWETTNFPNKDKLDSLFPSRPVLLKRVDGHAAIANQKALELANITTKTTIKGGVFKKEAGKLSGLLIDNAVDKVSASIPPLTKAQIKRALLKAQEMCFAKGLTTVDDAYMENHVVHIIDSLQKSGEIKMKVYGMLSPSEKNKNEFLYNEPYKTNQLNIRSFKYFSDGALGSRGAKLIEPYQDDPTNHGLFLNDSTYFAAEAAELHEYGFQMNTHCIGDAANRMILNIYESTLKGTNDERWRIEHAQIVSANDLDKFGANNIIPSVQPTHATSDMYWLEARLGEERSKTAYAWKDLLKQNGLLALGTDFPIEGIDPLNTFFAAVFRKDDKNYPKGGFQIENRLSREETIRGMTIWAAMANFEENEKGSLVKGKAADFIIINKDLMKVSESELFETKILSTYIDGEIVYSAK